MTTDQGQKVKDKNHKVSVVKLRNPVEYFLLHCENYEKDRKVTIDNLLDIVVSGKSKRSLRITDKLLLAPTYDHISKKTTSVVHGEIIV